MTENKHKKNSFVTRLETLGLTQTEAQVYVYLLERGVEVGGSKIALGSGLHRQYVYLALPKLLQSGLIEEVPHGKQAKYRARPPQEVEKIGRKQAVYATELARDLHSISAVGNEQDFDAIVGEVAYRAYELERARAMKDADVQYIIGSSTDNYLEVMAETYLEEYVLLMEKKNIKTYYIAPASKPNQKANIHKQHFEVRTLPNMKEGYITTMVQGELLVFYSNVKPPSIYVIKSEKVAQSYRDFFLMLWDMAA